MHLTQTFYLVVVFVFLLCFRAFSESKTSLDSCGEFYVSNTFGYFLTQLLTKNIQIFEQDSLVAINGNCAVPYLKSSVCAEGTLK